MSFNLYVSPLLYAILSSATIVLPMPRTVKRYVNIFELKLLKHYSIKALK